ncbi:MAG: adenylyl-sulfate kinase [Nitrososphaerota archaeon]|nr:adenylyl-sulfate kinase [Candidatus Bathyarchaeota archaeon]MCX8162507.1 adenylyl-sulfate kinase [Candidatus Bathyarchaeota archaeon]MDW8061390.1 adenylyl-sulfate kinase [Nitrososphaerota archaeon]
MKEGWAIWITGLPSSGKSTIARMLYEKLDSLGIRIQILESDELRKILTPNPTYTEEERDNFYRAITYIGWLLVRNGVNVIFDATASKRKYRDEARRMINRFMEVYLYCPLEVCMARDRKGLYRRALEGVIKTLPGLQVSYEEPLNPDLKLDTSASDPISCVEAIIEAMRNRGFI